MTQKASQIGSVGKPRCRTRRRGEEIGDVTSPVTSRQAAIGPSREPAVRLRRRPRSARQPPLQRGHRASEPGRARADGCRLRDVRRRAKTRRSAQRASSPPSAAAVQTDTVRTRVCCACVYAPLRRVLRPSGGHRRPWVCRLGCGRQRASRPVRSRSNASRPAHGPEGVPTAVGGTSAASPRPISRRRCRRRRQRCRRRRAPRRRRRRRRCCSHFAMAACASSDGSR